MIIELRTSAHQLLLGTISCSIIALLDSNMDLDEHQQLQLPHLDHPEDGHSDVVYGVHLQGDHLVSASADKTARIWDVRTQCSLHPPLIGHTGSVIAVQFDAAANNDVIITGDSRGNVMIWQFSTAEAVKTIAEAHFLSVLSLHFDQRYLVTGGKDGKVKLWNRHALDVNNADVPDIFIRTTEGDRYQEYSLLATFDGHRAAVNALKLSDNTLVSGSGDSTMCIWSLQNGGLLHRVNIHQTGIACLNYNGHFIVSGSTDYSVRIYDVNRKVEVACLKGHTNLVRCVQTVFDDRGEVKTILSGSYDGFIRVWEQVPGSQEWRTQRQVQISDFQAHDDVHSHEQAKGFGNRIFSVDLDAKRSVCSGQGPVIRVWNVRSPSK